MRRTASQAAKPPSRFFAASDRGAIFDDALRLGDGQPQRDRAFIRMLVTTTLRRRGQIDRILDKVLTKRLQQAEAVMPSTSCALVSRSFCSLRPDRTLPSTALWN